MSFSQAGCTITAGVLRSISDHLSLAAEKSGSEGVRIRAGSDNFGRKSDMKVSMLEALKYWVIDASIFLA